MSAPRSILIVLASLVLLTGCVERLEPVVPTAEQRVNQVAEWSDDRSQPYNIPERSLRGYAYAAWLVKEDSTCVIGWPTLAAIGQVYSDHGRALGASISEAGKVSIPQRGLDNMGPGKPIVPDTDGGSTDGDPVNDIAVGPMQIMPSRWEQFAESTEPGKIPDPDDIDDAALTTARILCSAGNPSTPEGWDAGITMIAPNPEVVKHIHAIAKEYSR